MKTRTYLPGIALVLGIAVLSYFLSTINASFDPLVISIIIAMLLGNVFARKDYFQDGIEMALKIFLPVGIACYGTQLSVHELQGAQLLSILAVFIGLFGFTLLIARTFNINLKASVLLASGLSVCGATAIAVISPLIGARREDTSIAIISVMMLGLTGMIFFPLVSELLALTKGEFNFLAGTTLPMLGQVKVAAGSVCPECLAEAVRIKLIRMSFLFFLVTAAVFISGREKKTVTVPWFVIVFVLLAVLSNVTNILLQWNEQLKALSSFCLSAGLAALGFTVDFDSIIEEGMVPLGAILFSWGVVMLLMYLVRNLF
ncbi:MAG: putative sulfate exporter family transporter [Nitrospirae bacterium]|nr:MAG: putative sulfate exporter family transporter [Nitrospirota bacterium]